MFLLSRNCQLAIAAWDVAEEILLIPTSIK